MGEAGKDLEAALERPVPVKIYGERNTGTSYLEQLLNRNLQVECIRGGLPKSIRRFFPNSERVRDLYFAATTRRNLGWKHASAPTRSQFAQARRPSHEPLFVTLTKNPYAWLLSLYRRPYHARRASSSLAEFLSNPWETVGRENSQSVFSNPIEMWNQKNGSYLALGEYATAVHCRYEDLLADPLRFLENLCSEHDIQPRRRPFQNVHESLKRDDRGKTFEDFRDYYLNERWRDDLDERCIRMINEGLDFDIVSRLDYHRIEASENVD